MIGVSVKINKAWIYIILICLVFLILGDCYEISFSLFIGVVGISAGIVCLLCELIIQLIRNQNVRK